MRCLRPFARMWPVLVASVLATAPAAAQTPIAGAEGWLLADQLPGVEQRTCTARITGPEANTTLIINNVGLPVLILGRADWNHAGGEIRITVSIDGAAPFSTGGSAVGNLVLVSIEDPRLLERLRGANMLDWIFPFGRFRANVRGLGTALDAVRACANRAARAS